MATVDPAFFINNFGWTYDPRTTDPDNKPATLPFILRPKQAECLDWLRERERLQESGLVEKSRDEGATWLIPVAYVLWRWRFFAGFRAGVGSSKLEYVDKLGDPKCIFEKIRFFLRMLPPWMLPLGFKWARHDNYCRLINPENGNTISGEGGDEIGRGDRASLYVVDESAFIEHQDKVDAALSNTTNCRIDLSTPHGMGNRFAIKRFSGTVPVFTFHWRDNPGKGEAWYAKKKAELDPVTLAQEIDIDYTASVEGVCIPAKWVAAAVNLDLRPSGILQMGLDVAAGGANKTVLIPRQGPVVYDPIVWDTLNTTQTARRTSEECELGSVKRLTYDVSGVGEGVKAALADMAPAPAFEVNPFNGGAGCTNKRWPDNKSSKEKFLNRRAECYWLLRSRFEKAYEFVELGIAHPPEEMISIPNCNQLIIELSLPRAEDTASGKIKIEAKEDMRRRGVQSPDYADALMMTEDAGPRKVSWEVY